jgi:hypothetical protein
MLNWQRPLCEGDPISKNPSKKKKNRAGGMTQSEGPKFKPQYRNNNNKKLLIFLN